MTTPCQEACTPWATEVDLCTPCDDYTFSPGLLDDALAGASDVLFMLSGRQFPGSCQDTVYPNWPSSDCRYRARSKELQLGGSPVTAIVEVVIDGETLDSSEYMLMDWLTLRRIEGTWPVSDDFYVTYTYGKMPPEMGVTAAGVLACEIAKACEPEYRSQCRLPKRTVQISRQGVSAVVKDLSDVFGKEQRTGIPEVDLFLATYNPNKLRRPAAIFNPDTFDRVRRANT